MTNNIDYDEIVKVICHEIDPDKIILFGSRARGDNKPDSDVDLLIVDKNPFNKTRSRLKTLFRIRKALFNLRFSKDILLYSEDEIEYWKGSINHIISRSLEEGRVLYKRH